MPRSRNWRHSMVVLDRGRRGRPPAHHPGAHRFWEPGRLDLRYQPRVLSSRRRSKVAITAIVHILGEDAFAADLDQMPDPTHTYVAMRNVRRKDGKAVSYLTDGATSVL